MWNFFEFKRILDRDEELLGEAAPPWMRKGAEVEKQQWMANRVAKGKAAISQPTPAPARPAVSVAPSVEEPPSVPTKSEPSDKTPLTRTGSPPAATPTEVPAATPTEVPAATPPTEAPAPGKTSLPRTTIPRTPPEPEAGSSTERPGADPNERFSGGRQVHKKLDTQGKENRFADRLRKLNGMIKGHTGPVVFGAQKAMNKFGIQYNPEIPFQISPSAGAIPEAQLQFNTPTGPIGGQEIVIADPKMLKKVVDAALRTGRDKREEPDVDDVADIKKQISNLPTSPITTRALKLERLININSLAGKTMSIEDLAEALHFMNLKGGLEKDDLDLDLAATKLLVKVAVDSDYPWIEVEEGANIDSNTMVKLEKLPNFDEELPTHTAGAIRYPTIPWLNVQQGLDPSKPMGGMKPGEGPAPEAPKQEMPAEDRIVAALDRFASYADRENIKIPDDPAERERFFDVDIPKIYRAIYGTIQKYMGELDDNTVDRLMQRADAIKDQLAAQWKIDFDAKPDVQEALRLREEIGWSRYNTLMEYYVK